MGYENFGRSVDVVRKGGTIINLPSGLSEEVKQKAIAKELVVNFFMTVFSDARDIETIAELLQEGIVKPHIFGIYNFDDIAQAHRQVESGTTVGKVVVTTN